MARDMKLDRGEADPPETLEEAVGVSTPRGAFFDEVLVSDLEDGDASDDVGHRPVRRRRVGRWVVVLVVLAVVLAAGAVGAEYLVRAQVDSAVRSALPGLSSDARIATKGVVLAQLVGGSLDSLSVDSKSMEIAAKGHGGTTVTLSDVDVDLGGIGLRNPYPADTVVAAGTISWKQVTELAVASHPKMRGMTLKAQRTGVSAQEPGTIQASIVLLGMNGEAEIVPSLKDDGSLTLTVTSIQVGDGQLGIDMEADQNILLSYIGMDSSEITIPPDSLPQGLHLTSAVVTDDGLRLALSGSKVNLRRL